MIAFFLRALPQLLLGAAAPIGFDTVASYAPFARLVQRNGLGTEMVGILQAHMAPLLWLVLGGLASTGIHPFALLEILPLFLYGALGASLWRFAHRGLGWSPRASLAVVVLTVSYFLPLRYGWDNLKDVMGLSLLFLALAEIRDLDAPRRRWMFAALAVGTVLTEEVDAVLLGGIAGVLVVRGLREQRVSRTWLLVGLGCVALTLFYAGVIGPSGAGPFPSHYLPEPISFGPQLLQGVTDYPNWGAKALAAGLLIALGVAPLLYPAWFGRFHLPLTDAWCLVASVGTVGVFFVPEGNFPVWPTWLLLLSFPLALSAFRGLQRMTRRRAMAFAVALAVLSVGFVWLPPNSALPYYASQETRWYVPTSMVQTAIPADRLTGVRSAVAWLNDHASARDWVVVSTVFAGFVIVDGNPVNLYSYRDVASVNWSVFEGSNVLYTIYWSDANETWYAGGLPPGAFQPRFAQGGVSVLGAQAASLPG